MPAKTRPDRHEALIPHTEPGDNAKYTAHSLQIYQLPEINTSDNEAVLARTVEYFELCAANDMKPSVAGYALALGIDRTYLWKIVTGGTNKPTAVVNTIKKAHSILTAQMEDLMQNGKINPVAGIFLMKNNMGYRDQTDVVVAPDRKEAPPEEVLIAEAEMLDD